MFCRYCGREVVSDAVYCPYCAQKIERSTTYAYSGSQVHQDEDRAKYARNGHSNEWADTVNRNAENSKPYNRCEYTSTYSHQKTKQSKPKKKRKTAIIVIACLLLLYTICYIADKTGDSHDQAAKPNQDTGPQYEIPSGSITEENTSNSDSKGEDGYDTLDELRAAGYLEDIPFCILRDDRFYPLINIKDESQMLVNGSGVLFKENAVATRLDLNNGEQLLCVSTLDSYNASLYSIDFAGYCSDLYINYSGSYGDVNPKLCDFGKSEKYSDHLIAEINGNEIDFTDIYSYTEVIRIVEQAIADSGLEHYTIDTTISVLLGEKDTPVTIGTYIGTDYQEFTDIVSSRFYTVSNCQHMDDSLQRTKNGYFIVNSDVFSEGLYYISYWLPFESDPEAFAISVIK